MSESFLFYDLETFGACPRRSRIAQFAAIRTDACLQPIDEPISFFVKPARDLLPSPTASLITGITPQFADEHGVNEAVAFERIAAEMMRPGTCTVGYNSLRFDDEFVRHGFFRNFHDPYEREWRGGNCRWDLLDVMRLAHALRPDGIEWTYRDDGTPAFTLEGLARANAVRTGDAHEALSDVRALIGMANRLRLAQPRLWDYALKLRDKRFCASLLDVTSMTPVLHVSQRFAASRLCAAAMVPLVVHPRIANRVVAFDLAQDPSALLDSDATTIAARLYARSDSLPAGIERVALKEIHLNRCPALIDWSHLRAADLARLRIDAEAVERNADRLRVHADDVRRKVREVFAQLPDRPTADCDAALYDGFLSEADRSQFPRLRAMSPDALAHADFGFRDTRLPELLFRYRARNWPASLDAADRGRWNALRRTRLADTVCSESSFDTYFEDIARLRAERAAEPSAATVLDALVSWGRELQAEIA